MGNLRIRTRLRRLPTPARVLFVGLLGAGLAVLAGTLADLAGLAAAPSGLQAAAGFLVGVSRSTSVQRMLGGGRLDNRLALRLGVGYLLFAAMAEVVGMPFLFPLGAALTAAAALQWSGSRAWCASIVALLAATVGSATSGAVLDTSGVLSSPFTKDQMGAIYLACALLGVMTILNAAMLTSAREVSEGAREADRVRRHDELLHAATHDPLTGLLNRAGFAQLLAGVLVAATAERGVGILYLDLDGFKAVNDTLGHQAGDELLHLAALRMQQVLRGGDQVARLGGDEFVVLACGIDKPESLAMLARRLEDALAPVFDLDGRQAHIGASVGTALAQGQRTSADDLLAEADAAMYRVKAARHAHRPQAQATSSSVLAVSSLTSRANTGSADSVRP